MKEVIDHYNRLVNEGNDPVHDGAPLKEHMDKWDGKKFLDELNLSPREDVLEIGVGTGRLAVEVAPRCGQFYGIDISPDTIKRAGENLSKYDNITLYTGDFMSHGFDRKFDRIYSSLTFMHFDKKPEAVLKAASLLEEEGFFLLSISKSQDEYIHMGDYGLKIYPDDKNMILEYFEGAGLHLSGYFETEFAHVFKGGLKPGVSFFPYGDKEVDYLKSRDKKLARVIDQIGHIYRKGDDDLFTAVVHHIIGQQISSKAQKSIWRNINNRLGVINEGTIIDLGREELQGFGITWRKADYILDFACKVKNKEFDLGKIPSMTDGEALEYLSSLKGVGIWTAEMILLFCLKRPDILSFGDLAIVRGIRMVYGHREVPKERFERYRKRFSPHCSVASLYFWAVAGGAIPELDKK